MVFIALILGGLYAVRLYRNNFRASVFPYELKSHNQFTGETSPIIILGDRMATHLKKYQNYFADIISQKLTKSIKITNHAVSGEGLHRTVAKLRSFKSPPLVIIYQGGSEEFREKKFILSEYDVIKKNLKTYKNDIAQSLMMFFPSLANLFYVPVKKITLTSEMIDQNHDVISENQDSFIKILEIETQLYELHLNELIKLSLEYNSLLILVTTPVNLNAPPKRTCEFSTSPEIEKKIELLRQLLKENNPKEAYSISQSLIQKASSHAHLFFIHGQIAKRLGKHQEALSFLKKAASFDCSFWRSTPIHNSIMRKIAHKNKVMLFDFAKITNQDISEPNIFYDDIYPEKIYYEIGLRQLGLLIKKILKL